MNVHQEIEKKDSTGTGSFDSVIVIQQLPCFIYFVSPLYVMILI